jgi:hypothetical protein
MFRRVPGDRRDPLALQTLWFFRHRLGC